MHIQTVPDRVADAGQAPRSRRCREAPQDRGGRSRRAVLRAGAAVAASVATWLGAAGCGLSSDDQDNRPAPPDPLAGLLAGAMELVGRYDAALAAHPELGDRLTPIRQAHRAHADALAELIGIPAPTASASGTASGAASGTASAPPADAAGTLAALRAAEAGARRAAASACLAAPAGRAPLLGSIAAARASHSEALRQ